MVLCKDAGSRGSHFALTLAELRQGRTRAVMRLATLWLQLARHTNGLENEERSATRRQ